MNVKQLSKAIGFEPENLLKQMSAAGLSHNSITDEVNNEDKKILLTFLKCLYYIETNGYYQLGIPRSIVLFNYCKPNFLLPF